MSAKTQPNRKTKVVLPLHLLAEAVGFAEAETLARAGTAYEVHPETIRRAMPKVAADAALRAIADAKREEVLTEWRPRALRAVARGLEALELQFEELGKKADPENLHRIAGAVHLLIEKLIVKDAAGMFGAAGKRVSSPRQDPIPSQSRSESSGAGSGASRPVGAPGSGPVPTGNA